jgi:hypothetical protein
MLELWIELSIVCVFFSGQWGWVNAAVTINKSMYFFINLFVSDILLVFLSKTIKPLEGWVFESISWIGLFSSSPWLWQH